MNIENNILKRALKNVYFLAGTACGGKTIMSKEIAKKYGFIHFNDNWHEENFKDWQALIDPKYQPFSSVRKSVTDWEAYFGRSVDEFLEVKNSRSDYDEYLGVPLSS